MNDYDTDRMEQCTECGTWFIPAPDAPGAYCSGYCAA